MSHNNSIGKISVVVPVCERVEHTLKNFQEYRSAVEALENALKDEDKYVRGSAAWALEQIKAKQNQ